MFKIVKKITPVIFVGAGTSCVSEGDCKEGKRCCGKTNEVKTKFNSV